MLPHSPMPHIQYPPSLTLTTPRSARHTRPLIKSPSPLVSVRCCDSSKRSQPNASQQPKHPHHHHHPDPTHTINNNNDDNNMRTTHNIQTRQEQKTAIITALHTHSHRAHPSISSLLSSLPAGARRERLRSEALGIGRKARTMRRRRRGGRGRRRMNSVLRHLRLIGRGRRVRRRGGGGGRAMRRGPGGVVRRVVRLRLCILAMSQVRRTISSGSRGVRRRRKDGRTRLTHT